MTYGVEDITLIYTDNTLILDITQSCPTINLTIAPIVDPTPGVAGTEWLDRQAVGETTVIGCPAAYWRHGGLPQISQTSETGYLALLDRGRHGHLIPAQLADDPTFGLPASADPRRVIRAPASFRTRDTPYVLTAIAEIADTDTTKTIDTADGQKIWVLLTVAGTIAGTARTTGLTALPDATASTYTAAITAGAEGWLLTGIPQAYD